MYPFIYIQIHMLEARVKQLEKQARENFGYNETLLVRLAPFLRKEATEKEVAKKEVVKKEVAENSMARVFFIMSYFYF
jgi:hypothetical protein